MFINAAAWYLWMQQEFVYVGDAGVTEPSGKSKRQGLDLSIRYQLTKTLYADVDLSTAKPRAIEIVEGMMTCRLRLFLDLPAAFASNAEWNQWFIKV